MNTGPAEAHDQPNEASRTSEKPSLTEIVRGMGVLLGPSLLLGLFVGFGIWAVMTGWVFKRTEKQARLLRPLAILGALFPWAYAFAIRPWHLRWGATNEELEKPLPGDELVPDPGIQSTRAITVHAPVEKVWQWLAQVGQDRGRFYSYEWLENLAGAQMRNADRIHPEWQHREVGETVFLHPAIGPKVAASRRWQ